MIQMLLKVYTMNYTGPAALLFHSDHMDILRTLIPFGIEMFPTWF